MRSVSLSVLLTLGLALLIGCTGRECIREVRCVETCGGEEISAGCGPCPAGTIDVLECRDAGEPEPDGGMCAAPSSPCDAVPCCSGSCCVVIPDGGAGGYLCYDTPPAGGSCL